ncbi:MAG: PGF-pre-PGF domain-containing protein [Methanosarcinaceae archaeon]|nr:PGF-pre-PGF domain-containing protein [Methanosarcinaceae archaeon]
MKNVFAIFCILLLISIFANASNASEYLDTDQDNAILLKNAVFDTSKQPSVAVKADFATTSQYSTETEEYYILQFKGNVLEEWKQTVKNTGALFFDYVPNNAFIVRMNSSVKSQVETMDIVQWIGPYQPAYKISPVFSASSISATTTTTIILDDDVSDIIVMLFDSKHNAQVTSEIKQLNGEIVDNAGKIMRVRIGTSKLPDIAAMTGVSWIEKYVQPVIFNDIAANITNVSYVQNTHGLTGSGQIVAVADTGLDTGVNDGTMHNDIEGRIVALHAWWVNPPYDYNDNGSADYNGHGTHVAGSVLGNGSRSSGQYAGMAPMAQLVFQALQYDSLSPVVLENGGLYTPTNLSSLFQEAYNDGAKIHSNSWGSGDPSDYGNYTSSSQHVDSFMWDNPDMLIVFAAGNDGADGQNTVSPPSTAKNALTVGASENLRLDQDSYSDNISQIASFSSRGPTDDNRVKPDLVAPGTWIISTRSSVATGILGGVYDPYYVYSSGTSMATPLTAGTAALVRQYYVDNESISPSAALIKATLINGAANMSLPTNDQGWGRVDIEKSLFPTSPRTMRYHDNISLTISNSWNVSYYINSSSEPLIVTLVWTDYPAATFVGKMLVNNLDLNVTGPDNSYLGNGGDDTNNVEQVKLLSPTVGLYTIKVTGTNIPDGPQPFALVISGAINAEPLMTSATANPSIIEANGTDDTIFNVTVTDPDGIASVTMNLTAIGGQAAQPLTNNSGIWQYTTNTTILGIFNLGVNATDNVGISNTSMNIALNTTDTLPPTSNTPTNIEFSANSTANFDHWKLYDLHPGYYWVLRNDTQIIPPTTWKNNTNITVPVNTSIGLGDFNYTIQYNDSIGNYGTPDTVIININDTTPPSASGEIPANGSSTYDLTPLISVNITDNASGVNLSSIVMTVNGTIVDIANTTIAGGYMVYNQTATPFTYTQIVNVTVNATDNNNNFMSYNWSFTVDGNAPILTDAAAAPQTIESNGTETTKLSVNITDDLSGISSVTINLSSIRGGANVGMQNTGNNYWINSNATGVGNGTFYLPINATDNAGNSNTSVNIILYVNDTTSPTLSNNTPATGTNNLTPTISINATDIGSGINVSSANMTVNGMQVLLANTSSAFTYNFSNTTTSYNHGETVNITFNVSDNEGHTANYSWTFYIDNVKPMIGITSPADGYSTTASSITILGAVNGTGSSPVVTVNDINAPTTLINFSGTFIAASVPISLGTNTIYANVTDASGNINTTSINVIQTSPEKPSSSGGGGGGGTSGEEYENIELKDVSRVYISANTNVSFTFREGGNDIQYIKYKALTSAGYISATTEVLKNTSALVKQAPSGIVYKNMNIWLGKAGYATEHNIENPVIGFRVKRSWIQDNRIDENSIKLNRYSQDVWSTLQTTKTGEDATYIYFESQTPGFSPFAITANKNTISSQVSIKSDTVTESLQPVEEQSVETATLVPETETVEEETSIWSNLLIGALILTIIAGAYLYIQKRQS